MSSYPNLWLARWDDFRTLKWIDSIKSPEFLLKQIRELLQSAMP